MMESCEDQDSREKVMTAISRLEGNAGKIAELDLKDMVDKMVQEEVAATEASHIKEQVLLLLREKVYVYVCASMLKYLYVHI